jgi:hypothetical protein
MSDPPVVREIDPPGSLTFGRSADCDVALGTDDASISRIAGEVSWADGAWELRNLSSSRPLHRIEDTGLRTTIPVSGVLALTDPITRIAIVGSIRTHVISFERTRHQATASPAANPTRPVDGDATSRPIFTRKEFLALVALLEGYLQEPPRYEPRPRTYAEAARRLGLPAAAVRKRIENARLKLIESGVVELRQSDARLALAEFLLATRTVRATDLLLLDPAPDPSQPS